MRATTKAVVALALSLTAVAAVGTPVLAAPEPHVGNPNASCQGTAWSEHGANGYPGEVADEHQFARVLVRGLGFKNLGVVNSQWAHVDVGTHQECEAAILEILGLK